MPVPDDATLMVLREWVVKGENDLTAAAAEAFLERPVV
jgi:hypothetical protein